MHPPAALLTLAAAVGSASAAFTGFNYGSTFTTGAAKAQSDFEAEFNAAKKLAGTNGMFTSARLYTMVQGATANDVISAIPAAISTKTSLLLGLWGSGGQASFDNEIVALKKTIDQYCGKLDGLVAGISVGSEDLYRNSPIGIENDGLPGANPTTLVNYIKQVRDTIKGSCLADAPVGHVDTWTSYVNATNQVLIDSCDWLGMDTYPYFEDNKPNSIDVGRDLFEAALGKVQGSGGGKPVWITETGWPVSGKTSGAAVANTKNAQTYWRTVGCPMFGKTNTWWYTLQDASPTTPNPSFGLVGTDLNGSPVFDLSCKGHENAPIATSSAAPTTSAAKSTQTTESSSSAPPNTSTKIVVTTTIGDNSSTQAPTTMSSPPLSTTVIIGGSGSSSSSGDSTPSSSTDNGAPQTTQDSTTSGTPVPTSGTSAGEKLNSVGAGAIAMIMAVALL